MAEYLMDKFEFPENSGNIYKLKPCYEQSKTFTGLIGSANNQANASFYYGKIVPTSMTDLWEIRYRETVIAAGRDDAKQWADCLIVGRSTGYVSYAVFNTIYSTSYYAAYYHNFIPITSAGFTNGHGHLIGTGMRSSWNNTTSANSRTVTIDIVDTKNCTFTFFDSALKYANVPGTGSTNYGSVTEFNFTSNGLQETGDATNIYQNVDQYNRGKAYTVCYRYQWCFTRKDESRTLLPANTVGNSTATNKTLTTESFDPFGEILYYSHTDTVNANNYFGGGRLYLQILADVRYSFNIAGTSASHLTANQPVYLVVTPQSDGSVKLATGDDGPLSQIIPETENGLLYIYLGYAYPDTYPYRINLNPMHPIYYYAGGRIRVFGGEQLSSWSDVTGKPFTSVGDGLTVASNVLKANLDTDLKISSTKITHNNVLSSAQTTQALYPIKIDKNGHISAYGSAVTIPTVNNATLTIQKNGTNVATFTANASSNVTANITVPTTVAELTDSENYAKLDDIPSIPGADRGISIVSNKYGHSNTAITANTTYGLYPIKYDAYGLLLPHQF